MFRNRVQSNARLIERHAKLSLHVIEKIIEEIQNIHKKKFYIPHTYSYRITGNFDLNITTWRKDKSAGGQYRARSAMIENQYAILQHHFDNLTSKYDSQLVLDRLLKMIEEQVNKIRKDYSKAAYHIYFYERVADMIIILLDQQDKKNNKKVN